MIMNREIKFRGKSEVTNEWVYGSLVKVGNESHIVGFDEVDLDGHHLSYCSDRPIFTKQGTIGQFTGKYDKNGKEIYEGDILRHLNGNTFQVLYSNRTTSFILISISHKEVGLDLGIYDTENCFEVIGNIYDNKELLEE
jgi:uncharacterized phage protein (TIGR01671 family)